MEKIGTVTGVALGIKLTNGRFRPKFGKESILSVIIFGILFLAFFCAFVYGVVHLNFEFILMPGIGCWGIGYLLMISHVLQSPKNYYITFQSEDSLDGFELLYKNKKVAIRYVMDSQGKIAFADNANKIACVSYADGSKMSTVTKYRIVNYFGKWLNENNLLSADVRTSLE